MGGKVGSVIGLVGGALAVAGFFMPWMTLTIRLDPLGSLADAAKQLLFGGTVPEPASFSGFAFLTTLSGGAQGLLAASGAPAGVPQPDLGSVGGILSLLVAVIGLVLLFSILTVVMSAVNLATGRLRAGVIGFGAGLLALSALILAGLQMLIGAAYQSLNSAAGTGSAAGGVLGGDPAALLRQVFQLSVGTGVYLCLVGGVLGVAGGVMGRKRAKKEAAPAEAAAAPVAETPK